MFIEVQRISAPCSLASRRSCLLDQDSSLPATTQALICTQLLPFRWGIKRTRTLSGSVASRLPPLSTPYVPPAHQRRSPRPHCQAGRQLRAPVIRLPARQLQRNADAARLYRPLLSGPELGHRQPPRRGRSLPRSHSRRPGKGRGRDQGVRLLVSVAGRARKKW